MRVRSLQQAGINREPEVSERVDPNRTPAMAPYQNLDVASLNLHEDRLERQYQRNLKALHEYRKWNGDSQSTSKDSKR
jgi:hypothetical protein